MSTGQTGFHPTVCKFYLCEICGKSPGKHDAEFDGYVCDDCKSQFEPSSALGSPE